MKKTERSSFSLTEEAWELLQKGSSQMRMSHGKLAILCLKIFLHKEDFGLPEGKGTINYNPQPHVKILTVRLEYEEHLNVQSLRIAGRNSVSYSASEAICRFLPILLRWFARKGELIFQQLETWFLQVESTIKAIHFNYGFSHKNIRQLRITMLRFRGEHANPTKVRRKKGHGPPSPWRD